MKLESSQRFIDLLNSSMNKHNWYLERLARGWPSVFGMGRAHYAIRISGDVVLCAHLPPSVDSGYITSLKASELENGKFKTLQWFATSHRWVQDERSFFYETKAGQLLFVAREGFVIIKSDLLQSISVPLAINERLREVVTDARAPLFHDAFGVRILSVGGAGEENRILQKWYKFSDGSLAKTIDEGYIRED